MPVPVPGRGSVLTISVFEFFSTFVRVSFNAPFRSLSTCFSTSLFDRSFDFSFDRSFEDFFFFLFFFSSFVHSNAVVFP